MISFRPDAREWAEIQAEAKQARLTGWKSNVREDEARRVSMLDEDRMVGLLGEWALSLCLTGTAEAFWETRAARAERPWASDDGEDLLGVPWDAKASRMRYSPDPMSYSLLVRDSEIRDGHRYACALVAFDWSAVHLVGYATSEEVRAAFRRPGRVRGSAGPHEIPAAKLHSMPFGVEGLVRW